MRRILLPLHRLITAISMLGVLTSCSMATVAYNNAGSLIGYALDNYVELTPPQETWLKDRVNHLIAWHRGSELPLWQRWVNETRERAAGNPEAGEIRAMFARGQTLLERTTEKMLPDMAALMRQLEPRQIAFLESKLAADYRKLAEEAAAPLPVRQSRRVERLRERCESWFGRLTSEQAAYLQARVLSMAPLEEMRLTDRQRWQREFMAVVKSAAEVSELQAELRILILAPEQRRDPNYQAEVNRQRDEMIAVTAWMVRNATPAQMARLQNKLSGYAEDIASMLRT